MSPMKEPHFYSGDMCRRRKVKYYEDYKKLFSGASKVHKVVGEASTTYLQSKVAVNRIENDYNSPKYIIMIRNPVKMAHSLHHHLVSTGAEHIYTFKEAWAKSNERRNGEDISSIPIAPSLLDYKKTCKIGEQVERFISYVDRKRVKVILLDDIKENPKEKYKDILKFLGLEFDNRSSFEKKNQSKERISLALQRGLRRVGHISREVKQLLGIPTHVGSGITKAIIQANTKMSEKPSIGKSLRREMKEYYRSDIKKIENTIGVNLDKWIE